MKCIVNCIRSPSIITIDTLLIKQYNAHIASKFVTAFLDDLLGGARDKQSALLFVLCIIDLFINLGVCFQLSK